ncbi:MAG: Sjogren's syndrome/scleroderma autoantigen 1 family protein [Archaeoglobaceae archaeon]
MGDKKISDEVIANAAELLQKGAKMLSDHCPECMMPLFEKDGRVFCVNCGETEERREEEKEEKNRTEVVSVDSNVLSAIESAIANVCRLIAISSDAEEISKLADALQKLVAALEKTKKLYSI